MEGKNNKIKARLNLFESSKILKERNLNFENLTNRRFAKIQKDNELERVDTVCILRNSSNRLNPNPKDHKRGTDLNDICEIQGEFESLKKTMQSKFKSKLNYMQIEFILSESNTLYQFSSIWKSKLKKSKMIKNTESVEKFLILNSFVDKFSSISKKTKQKQLIKQISLQESNSKKEFEMNYRKKGNFFCKNLLNTNCKICKKAISKMKDHLIIKSKNRNVFTEPVILHRFCYNLYKLSKKNK